MKTETCAERIGLAHACKVTGLKPRTLQAMALRGEVPGAASVISIGAEAQAIISRQPQHPSSPYLFVTRNGTHYKRVTEMWREVVARTQKLTQERMMKAPKKKPAAAEPVATFPAAVAAWLERWQFSIPDEAAKNLRKLIDAS